VPVNKDASIFGNEAPKVAPTGDCGGIESADWKTRYPDYCQKQGTRKLTEFLKTIG